MELAVEYLEVVENVLRVHADALAELFAHVRLGEFGFFDALKSALVLLDFLHF